MITLLLAVTMQPSLTMERLQTQMEHGTPFETVYDGAAPSRGPEPVKVSGSGVPSYHFKGATPVQGISIYTPVKDERGDEGTTRDPAKNPFEKVGTYAKVAGGIGLLGLIGGFFFAPLWILGGIGLGAAAVLYMVNKKLSPKD